MCVQALSEKAKDMVALAERFTSTLARQSADTSDDDRSQLQTCLLSLGIDTPVTRAAFKSGNAFHRELCKELASFLPAPMAEAKGIMTLTDTFCMYTRARGTDLVSPDDLLNACRQFEALGLPYRLRAFPNGVLALEHVTQSDDARNDAVLELARLHGHVSASAYAALKGVSLMVAEEHLRQAEAHGRLCRDDSIQGLRFYPNRFLLAQ